MDQGFIVVTLRVKLAEILRDCGTSGRTYKSALLFAVPAAGDSVQAAARNTLAWEDIDDDEDTKKRIDESQQRLLKKNFEGARRELDEAIFRSYHSIYLLGKDNHLREVDLGSITSSSAGSIVELVVHHI